MSLTHTRGSVTVNVLPSCFQPLLSFFLDVAQGGWGEEVKFTARCLKKVGVGVETWPPWMEWEGVSGVGTGRELGPGEGLCCPLPKHL